MKRKVMFKLIQWKEQTSNRLPLLIYGARQVGKTYIMKEFGAKYFDNVVYVNFEKDDGIMSYFEESINPEHILKVLEKYYHVNIIPEQTLIIFDEVQLCERALTSLKYFAEEAPEYHIIAAGSLLGVAINRKKSSFPVGKVQMITMYPLDFEEYLWAVGKELLAEEIRKHFNSDMVIDEKRHNEAMNEYYNYLIMGGMPAVILAQTSHISGLEPDEIKGLLLNSYIADMSKYAEPSESVKIFAAYDSLPMQLAKDNKKFQYKLIKSGARASQYGTSIDWLIQSGIVLKCGKCEQGYLPPAAFLNLSSFKLYYSDTGLFASRTNMTLKGIQSVESEHFRGIFAENYVAVALQINGYELMYWENNGSAEVDFLIVKDSNVIPIECKANSHVKSKSLSIYTNKYCPEYSIRISSRNFGFVNGIKSVPLYAVFCI